MRKKQIPAATAARCLLVVLNLQRAVGGTISTLMSLARALQAASAEGSLLMKMACPFTTPQTLPLSPT